MLVKQKLAFSKKCKNMNTKQEIVSDADFKAWSFSSDFNFACKDGRITKATWKYYCLLLVNPAITNCCKELHLKCDRVPRYVFENVTIHEDLSGFVWKPVFFLVISKCCHLYRKSLCFSLLPFTVWWSIFISLLDGRLLPLSCFYGSTQWLFKVKITYAYVHERARRTIIRARKSVHANIKFVEPCIPSTLWILSSQVMFLSLKSLFSFC